MSITYPLALPNQRVQKIRYVARNVVAVSQSPFTLTSQIHRFTGQTWEADITLPPMKRAVADQWIAFLLKLNGQFGTFLLPGFSAKGSAEQTPGSPTIVTATPGTQSLSITGGATSATGYLLAGDYIQLGTGVNSRLHQVLDNVNTNGSGAATFNIYPAIRATVSGAVDVASPEGVFRLATSDSMWDIDEALTYGITFAAVEAL